MAEETRLTIFGKFLLFIGAYVPILPLLLIKSVAYTTYFFLLCVFFASLIAISFVYWIYFVRDTKKQTASVFTIDQSDNQAAMPLSYLVPYILALIGFNLDRVQDLIVLLILMTWLFIVFLKSGVLFPQVLFFNPMFYLRGYKMYKIEAHSSGFTKSQFSTGLLMSKNDLSDLPITLKLKELDTGVMMDVRNV